MVTEKAFTALSTINYLAEINVCYCEVDCLLANRILTLVHSGRSLLDHLCISNCCIEEYSFVKILMALNKIGLYYSVFKQKSLL